jgi:hypothetical protein
VAAEEKGRERNGWGGACTAGDMIDPMPVCVFSFPLTVVEAANHCMLQWWGLGARPLFLGDGTHKYFLFRFPSFTCRLEIVWRCGDAFPMPNVLLLHLTDKKLLCMWPSQWSGRVLGYNQRLRSECLQLQPVVYMSTSSGFPLLNWGTFYEFLETGG